MQLVFAALVVAGVATAVTDAATGHPAGVFWPGIAAGALAVALDEDLHKP